MCNTKQDSCTDYGDNTIFSVVRLKNIDQKCHRQRPKEYLFRRPRQKELKSKCTDDIDTVQLIIIGVNCMREIPYKKSAEIVQKKHRTKDYSIFNAFRIIFRSQLEPVDLCQPVQAYCSAALNSQGFPVCLKRHFCSLVFHVWSSVHLQYHVS